MLDHEDGYETYYGLIADWSLRFKRVIGRGDDSDLQRLVGLEVETSERLGWVERTSPIWARIGARKKDGTPVSPLTTIRGFTYADGVQVVKNHSSSSGKPKK